MATLWIRPTTADGVDSCTSSAPALRDWLAGDWCLLFSHPQDFQCRGLEVDRWLDILRDEFRAQRVRPLACAGAAVRDTTWTGELFGDDRIVVLQRQSEGTVDLAARALCSDLCRMQERFVLIIDEALRRRGVLMYASTRCTISPFDLLASVSAMQRPRELRRAA
jgi:hypothetical protein